MRVKIKLEGEDERLVKIMAIQTNLTPEQFTQEMIKQGLQHLRAAIQDPEIMKQMLQLAAKPSDDMK